MTQQLNKRDAVLGSWEAVAREWERVGTLMAGSLSNWIDRVLYTDAQWVAMTWPTVERSWLGALWAWIRGVP